MPRKACVEFAGAAYHLLDRGDRREPIFRDERDREIFLATLGQVCERTGWRVHAWVLMTNHYHLLVETPQPNLVAGMRWFQTTYTVRFNRRHRLSGHLFQGRYKAVVVNPDENGYFVTLSDYIHLNPVRARMIALDGRLFDYRWSSYRWYATKKERPEWFEPARVLGELGFNDTAEERRRYPERMRGRAVDELADKNMAANDRLRRGWCLGEASFRERMLSLLEKTAGGQKGSVCESRQFCLDDAPAGEIGSRRSCPGKRHLEFAVEIHRLTLSSLTILSGSWVTPTRPTPPTGKAWMTTGL